MKCPRCQGKTVLVPSRFNSRTDSDFDLTGKIDKRVGGPPITGRTDWEDRLKEQGLVTMTKNDMDNAERREPQKEHEKALDKVFESFTGA